MVQHKKQQSQLGRAVINSRLRQQAESSTKAYIIEKEVPKWVKLQSTTEEKDLDNFLNTAELKGTEFLNEREEVKVIRKDDNEELDYSKLDQIHKEYKGKLRIPRRPSWDESTTAQELEENEQGSFLTWRRNLAALEEMELRPKDELEQQNSEIILNNHLILTPFERNLELWRQLWRVLERSVLIVQIIDARNPLLFRSEDLEAYVHEMGNGKRNLLLFNKADLLSIKQRKEWARYCRSQKIPFIFFSAKADELDNSRIEQSDDEDARIMAISELEEVFLSNVDSRYSQNDGPLTIGLVGYPNVGKSSTINALIGDKKVSVSATPGKTKHFQTIHLSSKIILCDCPGLVFPNFAYSRAELVVNGILPVDQMRDAISPSNLVAKRIKKNFMEALYGIRIYTRPIEEGGTGIPTGQELLNSYAAGRGFFKAGVGSPDDSRAARYVLKDFNSGKLCYVHPPPDYSGNSMEFNKDIHELSKLPDKKQLNKGNTSDKIDKRLELPPSFDGEFFRPKQAKGVRQTEQSAAFTNQSRINEKGEVVNSVQDLDNLSIQEGIKARSKKHYKAGKYRQ